MKEYLQEILSFCYKIPVEMKERKKILLKLFLELIIRGGGGGGDVAFEKGTNNRFWRNVYHFEYFTVLINSLYDCLYQFKYIQYSDLKKKTCHKSFVLFFILKVYYLQAASNKPKLCQNFKKKTCFLFIQ